MGGGGGGVLSAIAAARAEPGTGLWPSDVSGDYPCNCPGEAFDVSQLTSILPEVRTVHPGVVWVACAVCVFWWEKRDWEGGRTLARLVLSGGGPPVTPRCEAPTACQLWVHDYAAPYSA